MNLEMGVRTVCAHRRNPSVLLCVSACARKRWSILCGVPAHRGLSGRRSFLVGSACSDNCATFWLSKQNKSNFVCCG